MRSLVAVLFLAVASPALVACSSEEDEPLPKPVVAEPTSIDASAATKEDLGVVVWGADGDERGMRVVGYDARGANVVTVEQRAVWVDARQHYFETTIRTQAALLRARLDGTTSDPDAEGKVSIHLVATENTIVASPYALRVVEHLQGDFEAGQAPEAASLLAAQGLRVQENGGGQQLVGQPSCLSQGWRCGLSLYRFVGPLLPCVSAARAATLIVGCSALGAPGGPAGVGVAVGLCQAAGGGVVAYQSARCAQGVTDTYNRWGERSSDASNSCRSAVSACGGGGGGAATSSLRVAP